VWLATADAGWHTGGYFADRSRSRRLPAAADGARAAELWELSAELVGLPS
jgi:hypothetical protein